LENQGCFVLDSTQMETNMQLKTDENGYAIVQDGMPLMHKQQWQR